MLRRVQVRETNLKQLVQGEKQFRVPLWQRQYTWRKAEHALLWRDILEQYARVTADSAGSQSGHFLGSIVLSPVPSAASGIASYLIVDGQQRLTTLMLILAAVRDAAAKTEPQAIERYNELYLINKFQRGEERFRLLPTQADRASYFACLTGGSEAGGQDPIGLAYRFFRSHLELLGPDEEQLDLERLTGVVVGRLAVVDITTGTGDNAHRIFQSLNATGVNLTQADLLRNLIFMLLPSRAAMVYDEVWRPMERLIGFDNLEGLARVDLQRHGIDVAVDDVFRRHQDRLENLPGGEQGVENAVRDLALRARHYKRLIDPASEQDEVLRAGLWRLRRWGAQTSYPVLMAAYDLRERGLLPVEGLREVVSYIESFLVRRQLAGIPPNALNRLFVQFVGQLPQDDSFPQALRRELSRQRRYWPSDEQLREAIRTRPFYFSGRGPQRKLILERLEQSYGHPEQVDFESSDLTVEHILPQTLSEEWRGHLISLGQDPDEVHQTLVHTLGNLTLTAFNGQLSNNPFERKRQIYGGSHLELNRTLTGQDAWGRDQILARADELVDRAITIWPGPLPGMAAPPAAFDWSRINAAVAAIPRGRWTTYGELARLGGAAAMPVGQHIANTPGLDNGYRVLGSDGKPRPDFRWSDPSDERDPAEVLMDDGVRFDSSGVADPAQRISAEELSSLIEVLDDDTIEASTAPTEWARPQEWDWERYAAELGIPDDRLSTGRELVNLLSEAVEERNLPWKPTFRKGYVAFQRTSGYNTVVVDLYSRKVPRLAVILPETPTALSLVSPYPQLQESWYEDDRQWGWTIDPTGVLPDVRPAIDIAERFHPSSGPASEAPDRQWVREQLLSGLTPGQVYTDAGEKRVYWLTALEEEARLANELAAFPKTPESVAALRDQRQLRWERIATRIFGEAQRVAEVRNLYDQARGPGASSRSYAGHGRRFPEMSRGEPHSSELTQPSTAASTTRLLISPRGIAHFPECPHKGDDPDYNDWQNLTCRTPGGAWEMGSVFLLQAESAAI
jgi:alkylated DNA nucleotide flippase Atl1